MLALGDRRILLVEDDAFLRQTVRSMLYGFGKPTIGEAAGGHEALRRIAKDRPDLIICDLHMQPMDGLEFIARVRADPDPRRHDIPVIILTAKSDRESLQQALKLGISGYLLKPVSIRQLAERIGVALAPPRNAAAEQDTWSLDDTPRPDLS